MRRAWLLLLSLAGLVPAQEHANDPIVFSVSGTVVDGRDRTCAGVAVQAWDALDPARYLGQTTTGAKGAYLLPLRRAALARREHAFGPVILSVGGSGFATRRVRAVAGTSALKVVLASARSLRGRVVAYDGTPAPAAVVRASLATWDSPAPPAPEVEDTRGLRVWEETTTGEDGRFTLERLVSAELRIDIIADALVMRSALAPFAEEQEFRLPKPHVVKGRTTPGAELLDASRKVVAVADANGNYEVALAGPQELVVHAAGFGVATTKGGALELRPVAPVKGRVVDEKEQPLEGCRVLLMPRVGPPLVAWTDDRGRYAFEVGVEGMVPLRAELDGYLPVAVRVEAPAELTLQLVGGRRLLGVVFRDGQPALGVRVSAVADGREAAFAYTDAAGRFLMEGVPEEVTRVFAREKGRRSAKMAANAEVLKLDLKGSLPYSGVVKGDTGRPLAGAEVECKWGRDVFKTKTDAQGRFRFDALPVQGYRVDVSAEGHWGVSAHGWPGDTAEFVCNTRLGESRLDVAVDVDDGRSVRVTVHRREEPRVRRSVSGRAAVFQSLPDGTYDVLVEVEGYLDARRVVELKKSSQLTVAPQRGGSLRITATPGAAVAIQRISGKPPPVAVIERAGATQELRGFGPGVYRFFARARGELIVIREVELGPQTPPVDLDLRGGKESTLTIDVSNAAGEPVAGAEVILVTESGYRWNTRRTTGADGRVVLKRLVAGRLEVQVRRGNRVGGTILDVKPGRALRLEIAIR